MRASVVDLSENYSLSCKCNAFKFADKRQELLQSCWKKHLLGEMRCKCPETWFYLLIHSGYKEYK